MLSDMSGKRLLYTYIMVSGVVSLLVFFAVQVTNKIINNTHVLE